MNTSKQINVMLGLFIVFAIGTTLYFAWDSSRADEATDRQLRVNAERGAELFALNCRSCHGITGQGPLERGGLPGAPLNVESSRPTDEESGEPIVGELTAIQQRFADTITCGRIGTVMPPWSQEQGGPLNFFQIEQIVTMITGSKPADQFDPPDDLNAVSEEAWEFAYEEANHADEFDPAKHLAEATGTDDTTIVLNDASGIAEGAILRLGGDPEEPEYELVMVTEVNEDSNEITVERGAEGTDALEHEEDTEVFGNFVPPGTTITGEEGFVCGQTAGAAGGGGNGDAATVQVEDSAAVSMGDNFFDLDGEINPTIEVGAGASIAFDITNDGQAIHNMRIAGVDNEYDTDDDAVSDPHTMVAGDTGTLEFSLDQPGTYDYRCDFHPVEMAGKISVVE